ncbi:ABC transporter permease [Lichenicola sp.]|uniref:ABC transporter permease n=1 Tax=Lichenicola sp. TaxID=2804529 RepID=UPI003B000839
MSFTLRTALRLALRDWRGGPGMLRGMGIVLLCLTLGVAAIGTIGGLRDAIQSGVAEQRRAILGGDLAIESSDPLPDTLAAFLAAQGARTSTVIRMRSMVYGPAGRRMLVELYAVDAAYPLVGLVTLAHAADPQPSLVAGLGRQGGRPGLLAEALVHDRLGAAAGTAVRVGDEAFRLGPILERMPDAAGSATLAPTVLIARAALDEAGLLRPGALYTSSLRVVLPDIRTDETAAARLVRARALAQRVAARFPGEAWHIRDINDAAPALTRVVDQVALFMTLIALAALLLGGMGVAAGVSSWLGSRTATIAVLRSLGAPPALAVSVFGIQVAGLCAAGILLGAVIGLALPPLAVRILADLLPVAPKGGLQWAPVGLASVFGIVVATLFTLAPMARAMLVPPAVLFRGPAGQAVHGRRLGTVLGSIGLSGLLVLLAVLTSPNRWLALGFCVVSALVLLGFRLSGWMLTRLAQLLPRPAPRPGVGRVAIRLGLAALGRPAAPASRLLLALGAGLTVLATVALAEGDLRAAVLGQLPKHAPSFYFIDLQPDEIGRFGALLHGLPSVGEVRELPSLRTRVVAVDGVPAEQVQASAGTRWALRGDHGLTIAGPPPPDTHVIAGHWWPADYSGPPLLSFDAGLAKGWGVHVGSIVRLNVLGRDIDLRVASLREIAWQSLQLNFAFMASPGVLSAAPHTVIATVATSGRASDDAAVLAAVTDALPNVTGIRVADILAQLGGLVRKLAVALAAIGAVALLSGGLVLAATLAAAQRQRIAEAAILRVLGATGAQLRAAWLVEFAILGGIAGSLAAAIGAGLSWLLMRLVLRAPWAFLTGTVAAVILAAIALMLAAGFLATRRGLAASPAVLLRQD